MTGAEPFRLCVLVESSVLVFPVCMGLFRSWGPLRGRCVRVVGLLGLVFVEEFIEEVMHGGCSGRTAGNARRG